MFNRMQGDIQTNLLIYTAAETHKTDNRQYDKQKINWKYTQHVGINLT